MSNAKSPETHVEHGIVVTPEYWTANPSEIRYTYLHKKERCLFNVGSITNDIVSLWTVNAWGNFVVSSCLLEDFQTTYERHNG